MIIFRYLVKEVIQTVLATTAILMLIFLCTQFVHYLSDAAVGKFTAKILLHVMMLQIPYLLGLLMPAGLYLALLLSLGRLYVDREMTVLFSCGLSQKRLLAYTMIMAFAVMIVVAILNLWLAPIIAKDQKQLFAQAKSAPLIETMLPGRFFASRNGQSVLYVQNISRDHTHLKNLFIAQRKIHPHQPPTWSIVVAHNGYVNQNIQSKHGLVIADGHRYQGMPGTANFQVDSFGTYSIQGKIANASFHHNAQTMSTLQLLKIGFSNPDAAAELEWRFSMPLSVIILTLLALPLSKVDPRQGKFAQLIPAVLIYIIYANMMFMVRSWIQEKQISPYLGVWWLHGLLLLLALIFMAWKGSWWQRMKRKLPILMRAT